MTRPVLYLDIVGTLLIDRGGDFQIAPGAHRFLDMIRGRFEVRFLSELQEHQVLRVATGLGITGRYVPHRRNIGKAASINFRENFYWVDDDPAPADLLRLSDERCSERLINVNKREGVSEATYKKIMEAMAESPLVMSEEQE